MKTSKNKNPVNTRVSSDCRKMKENEKRNIRAVNQRVLGSSPRGGAKREIQSI